MTTAHLPAKIKKKSEPPVEVPVEIQEKIVSAEEAKQAMVRLGLNDVAVDVVHDLETVGIYVKARGVLKVQRGRVLVTQQRIEDILREITDTVKQGKKDEKGDRVPLDVDELAKLVHAAGYIFSKQTESQKFAVEMERVRATTDSMADDEEPSTKSFKPGSKVQPKKIPGTAIVAQTVHIHQTAPAQDKK